MPGACVPCSSMLFPFDRVGGAAFRQLVVLVSHRDNRHHRGGASELERECLFRGGRHVPQVCRGHGDRHRRHVGRYRLPAVQHVFRYAVHVFKGNTDGVLGFWGIEAGYMIVFMVASLGYLLSWVIIKLLVPRYQLIKE